MLFFCLTTCNTCYTNPAMNKNHQRYDKIIAVRVPVKILRKLKPLMEKRCWNISDLVRASMNAAIEAHEAKKNVR